MSFVVQFPTRGIIFIQFNPVFRRQIIRWPQFGTMIGRHQYKTFGYQKMEGREKQGQGLVVESETESSAKIRFFIVLSSNMTLGVFLVKMKTAFVPVKRVHSANTYSKISTVPQGSERSAWASPWTVSGQNKIGRELTLLALIQPTVIRQQAGNNNWLWKLQPAVILERQQKSNLDRIERD